MRILSAIALEAAYDKRFPNQGGQISGISASASAGGPVEGVQAAAVKGYSASSGPLKWVKAVENFFEAGEHVLIGDLVQVKESIANWLVSKERAVFASSDELAEAQKAQA